MTDLSLHKCAGVKHSTLSYQSTQSHREIGQRERECKIELNCTRKSPKKAWYIKLLKTDILTKDICLQAYCHSKSMY